MVKKIICSAVRQNKRKKVKSEAGATAINPNWPPLNTDRKKRVWNFYLTVNNVLIHDGKKTMTKRHDCELHCEKDC